MSPIPRRARNSDLRFSPDVPVAERRLGLAHGRSGWPNPLGSPRSEIQNVSYRLRQQRLERTELDQQAADRQPADDGPGAAMAWIAFCQQLLQRRRALAGDLGPPAEAAAGLEITLTLANSGGDNPPSYPGGGQ